MSPADLAQVSQYGGMLYGFSEFALLLFRRAKPSASGAREDRGSLALVWVGVLGSIALAVTLVVTLPQAQWPSSEGVQVLGLALLVAGLALRWYAILYLGRYFTVNVAVTADQPVIDTGPYRWVRHPSYTGALVALLGLGLSWGNAAALAVVLLGSLLALSYRISVEEQALLRGLGEPYRAYMQRTRRLIPGLY